MIRYFSNEDEDLTLGIYSDSDNHKQIVKHIEKNLSYSFYETEEQDWIEDIDFPTDTIIVKVNNFTEDFIDLVTKKIYVYTIH